MKEYLVCANASYTNGEDRDINFTLKADDIAKSVLSFIKGLDVKSVSEITE